MRAAIGGCDANRFDHALPSRSAGRPSGSAMHRCAEPRLDRPRSARRPRRSSRAPGQAERIAGQLGARRVGEVLAPPRDHHRERLRQDRRQQNRRRARRRRRGRRPARCRRGRRRSGGAPPPHIIPRRAQSDSSATPPTSAATTVISRDVEVADVAHLVGDDALQLVAIERVEQPPRHGDRRVLRVRGRWRRRSGPDRARRRSPASAARPRSPSRRRRCRADAA